MEFSELEGKIGYTFRNKGLLEEALTHISYLNGERRGNERLEFLGDSVLNFVITLLLMKRFKREDAGFLSNARSVLVRREMLTEIAKRLEFEKFILYKGKKEDLKDSKVLSDLFEALIAAIFLDGGIRKVRTLLRRIFLPYLKKKDLNRKDPKNLLQELTQKEWKILPHYTIRKRERDRVVVAVKVKRWEAVSEGRTRKEAEEKAAEILISKLSKEKGIPC